jgi:hypothetical protein
MERCTFRWETDSTLFIGWGCEVSIVSIKVHFFQ